MCAVQQNVKAMPEAAWSTMLEVPYILLTMKHDYPGFGKYIGEVRCFVGKNSSVPGQMVHTTGDICLMHGLGTMYYANGGGTYTGEWQIGQRHGNGRMEFVNGVTFTGSYTRDHPDPFQDGTLDYGDGSKYTGGLSIPLGVMKYNRHGVGVYHWLGQVYDGDWRDDKMHGEGSLQFVDGITFRGAFVRDEGAFVLGSGTLLYPAEMGGGKYVGELKGIQRHGIGTLYLGDAHNTVLQCEWNEGMPVDVDEEQLNKMVKGL